MKTLFTASVLALGLYTVSAQAAPRDLFTDIDRTAPLAGTFEDINQTAPRSSFSTLNETAPRTGDYFDDQHDSAPRSGDLRDTAPRSK
jgi:hypothetical protein